MAFDCFLDSCVLDFFFVSMEAAVAVGVCNTLCSISERMCRVKSEKRASDHLLSFLPVEGLPFFFLLPLMRALRV